MGEWLGPPTPLIRPTLFLSSPHLIDSFSSHLISVSLNTTSSLYGGEERHLPLKFYFACFLLSDFFCDASLRARKEGPCSFFGEKEKNSLLLARERKIVKLLNWKELTFSEDKFLPK